MATTRFKQINAFINKANHAPHAAHLSWMQRFQERVQTLIVTELGQDCPAMIVSQNTALVAAVQAEDEGLQSNEGWTVSADDEVLYQQRRLLDKQGEPVDAATKVEAGQYSLEAAPDSSADGGDVTPVTPE